MSRKYYAYLHNITSMYFAFLYYATCRLAMPGRSTKGDMAPYNRARPSARGPITLVLTQRGCVHRIVQSGVSLWRRLCSLMGTLLDDDDKYA